MREPLNPQQIRDGLAGSAWRRIDVVDDTGSTNADLLARAAADEDIDGHVLIAEHQRDGRGRGGRSWSAAPRSQIALSVGVCADGIPIAGWGWLPLAAGVAVVDAVAGAGVEARLKWPNDVLAGPAGSAGKLAGILAEVAAPRQVIVVGIGLNVTLRPEEVGVPELTSLAHLGVDNPDRAQLVCRLLSELGRRISDWRSADGSDPRLMADYRASSLTIGSQVRAVLPGGREIVGTAAGVDQHGRLSIDTDGHTTTVSAGDVVHVRANP